MTTGKHRKTHRFTFPRVLLTLLLVHGVATVLTIALVERSRITLPSLDPNAPLENMTLELPKAPTSSLATTIPTTQPPIHTEPQFKLKADVTTQAPTTSPTHSTTSTNKTTTTTTTPNKTAPSAPPALPAPAPPASKVAAPTDTTFRARFFAQAQSFLGKKIPYVFGGKTLSALDCSGFIWLAIKPLNSSQPYRDSSTLNTWTTNISKSQALPGDLVFWPGHVAVYAGNDTVITQGGPGPGPLLTSLWYNPTAPTFGRIPL